MRNNECGKSEVKCNVISEVSGVKVGVEDVIPFISSFLFLRVFLFFHVTVHHVNCSA